MRLFSVRLPKLNETKRITIILLPNDINNKEAYAYYTIIIMNLVYLNTDVDKT